MTTPSSQSVALCVCGDPHCDIPFGYCHCRCGQKTKICAQTIPSMNRIAGRPYKTKVGHCNRIIPQIEIAAPFKINGVYCRLIPLTKGQCSIVWESDYEYLMRWKWYAKFAKTTGTYYAARSNRCTDGAIRQRTIRMHQVLVEPKVGYPEIDHENGVTLDNRRDNLRRATKAQNQHNSRTRRDSATGVKGVKKRSNGAFEVTISADTAKIYLGTFRDFDKACAIRREGELRYHGEYART